MNLSHHVLSRKLILVTMVRKILEWNEIVAIKGHLSSNVHTFGAKLPSLENLSQKYHITDNYVM